MESMSKSKYVCEQCDKVFKSNATIDIHMKKYHEQEGINKSDHNLETLRESGSDNLVNLSSLCVSKSECVSSENEIKSGFKCKHFGKIFCEGNI